MKSEAKIQKEEASKPDASGWSREMDALLLERRQGRRLTWKAVAPIGVMNERRCQARFKLLTSGAGRPAATVAKAPAAGDLDRDGLDWLKRKGRLTPRRTQAAELYRRAFRNADGPSVKSCLDVTVGGGTGRVEAVLVGSAAAKRELFALRWVVLGGQEDLLTVCDAVCGVGHTLRALAGDDGSDRSKRRQAALEAVLMVALDLIARRQDAEADAGARSGG